MILHFNATGECRKELVKVIETSLGIKAKYLGMPSAAYQIGEYMVTKDGSLTWDDQVEQSLADLERTSSMIDTCVMAGFEPEEWENSKDPENEGMAASEKFGLTVELPREQFTDVQLENLQKLITAKAPLLKEALAIKELPIAITDEKISFPWFKEDLSADECTAYTCLITAICQMAKEAKRVTAKEKEVENVKYAFRCFLLRLGFIGDEYKQNRKILMRNLTGSSAFKNGAKKGGGQ